MAVFAAIAFTSFFLEDDNFVTFYERSCHFANYFCTFYGGCANLYVAVGIDQKNTVKFYCFALFFVVTEVVNFPASALNCCPWISTIAYIC